MSRFVPIFINAFTATERLIELDTIEQEQTAKNRVILSAILRQADSSLNKAISKFPPMA